MRARAIIHVAGPRGAGKTTFIEALLVGLGAAPVLVARCTRDDALRRSRETAPRAHPELRRYRAAGAVGAAVFAFPAGDLRSDAFFMTDLMADYSQAVVLEGDNPIGFADLEVFVAPAAVETLFIRRRPSARAAREQIHAMERLLRRPDGMAELVDELWGEPLAALLRRTPDVLSRLGEQQLARMAQARRAQAHERSEHWTIAKGYEGIEHARLVAINVRREADRKRGERLVADLGRLRTDPALFHDILGSRGDRVPATAVVANLASSADAGTKKAILRVRRALRSRPGLR